MTNMKRTTVSLPDELVKALRELKENPEFSKCSDSELIRRMVLLGLEKLAD